MRCPSLADRVAPRVMDVPQRYWRAAVMEEAEKWGLLEELSSCVGGGDLPAARRDDAAAALVAKYYGGVPGGCGPPAAPPAPISAFHMDLAEKERMRRYFEEQGYAPEFALESQAPMPHLDVDMLLLARRAGLKAESNYCFKFITEFEAAGRLFDRVFVGWASSAPPAGPSDCEAPPPCGADDDGLLRWRQPAFSELEAAGLSAQQQLAAVRVPRAVRAARRRAGVQTDARGGLFQEEILRVRAAEWCVEEERRRARCARRNLRAAEGRLRREAAREERAARAAAAAAAEEPARAAAGCGLGGLFSRRRRASLEPADAAAPAPAAKRGPCALLRKLRRALFAAKSA